MESFEEVFSKYFSKVYAFALKLTRSTALAEDITQQTFFKALKKFDSFEGRSDIGTWLCSIAKNEYFSLKKRDREDYHPPGSLVFEGALRDDDGDDARLMQIHAHLHDLAEPYREVFMLRIFGELKYSQIAKLFAKTESWARVTFYRAKVELQERIKEDDNG